MATSPLALGTAAAGLSSLFAQGASSAIVSSGRPPLLLLTMMPDDSGSITQYGNASAIRAGHNGYLDNFAQSPSSILVRTRYLNGHELFGFCKPEEAVRMDRSNYNPGLGTPLFDQTYHVLHEVMSAYAVYADDYKDHEVFTMTFIITDGADLDSRVHRASTIKPVVDRMFASSRHVVAGIGVRDGRTDFAQIFGDMGIPEQWIKVLERDNTTIVREMTRTAATTHTIVDDASFHRTVTRGFSSMGDDSDQT